MTAATVLHNPPRAARLSYMPASSSLTIRLEPDLLARLDETADRQKVSRSDAARRILRSVLVETIDAPPDDGRVPIAARVQPANAERLDQIAATRPGWSRSDALRHLLGLGLAEYDRCAKLPPPRAAPAHGPAQIDAATHAKLQKGRRQ